MMDSPIVSSIQTLQFITISIEEIQDESIEKKSKKYLFDSQFLGQPFFYKESLLNGKIFFKKICL